ncbi:MAG TPA: PASTA domain-containing protein [Solirubrobacterales bacterium]|nr:PASTA domain-containing protein [Solirubrobacterales bacterium]
MRLQEGLTLDGRYTLTRRLGSGGMADVWCANDSQLGREVALKVLHENFARDTEFVERFRREASSAAGLQHPNVVGVFDRGELEDTYYIAMEYIDGSSLKELIERGLTIPEAVEVTRQVLSAAEFAHERNIVHRDLKPLNVLIDRSGRIRVTDFGIASAGGSEITQTGSVMGTAQYLSPEQAQGMEVTASSDVYSIGVMLFEMLTGRVPFDGDSPVAIAMKQVSESPPPPSSINPQVPPALDSVVLRALAKDPANRYQSAAEMHAALDAAEANPEVAGHTERYAAFTPPIEEDPRDRKWWWIAGAAALLLLIAALLWFFVFKGDDQVRVPGVTGEDRTTATLRLERAGFKVDIDSIPNQQPEDTVLEQDPEAGGMADEGSTVTLQVSLGPEPVAIPKVVGVKLNKARRRLRKAGFEVQVTEQSDDSVAAGVVISSNPTEGVDFAPGQTVTLVVSEGSDQVSVPSVVGLDRFEAKQTLEDAGFFVSQSAEDSDEPENEVIRQIPGAGTAKEDGSQVTIVYSTGAGSITLDNYIGETQGRAERQIENLDLRVSIRTQSVDDESDDGIVLEQEPGPNSRLSPGDTVRLVVGEFTPSTGTGAGDDPGDEAKPAGSG